MYQATAPDEGTAPPLLVGPPLFLKVLRTLAQNYPERGYPCLVADCDSNTLHYRRRSASRYADWPDAWKRAQQTQKKDNQLTVLFIDHVNAKQCGELNQKYSMPGDLSPPNQRQTSMHGHVSCFAHGNHVLQRRTSS